MGGSPRLTTLGVGPAPGEGRKLKIDTERRKLEWPGRHFPYYWQAAFLEIKTSKHSTGAHNSLLSEIKERKGNDPLEDWRNWKYIDFFFLVRVKYILSGFVKRDKLATMIYDSLQYIDMALLHTLL